MKLKELRALSDDELIAKEKLFKQNLYEITFSRQMGRTEKPSQFSLLRRTIARILTILKERQGDGTKQS